MRKGMLRRELARTARLHVFMAAHVWALAHVPEYEGSSGEYRADMLGAVYAAHQGWS